MDIEEYEASLQGNDDSADIETAIKNAPQEPEPESVPAPQAEPNETDNEPPATEPSKPANEPPPVTTEPPVTEPEKRVQTPEENARFAEERRQRQAEQRAQEALEKLKKDDPAFQTAKILEELYGAPISQIQAQLEQARIAKIAEQQNLPVEAVKNIEIARKAQETAQQELVKTQFAQWNTRMELEGQKLQQAYPMLTAEDLKAASLYMIDKMKNPELPLEDAVFAIHGKKINSAIQQSARTEALAELSGRNNSPLPPQGGKPPEINTLSADEKYIAKMMGLSEEDYLKFK